MSEHPTLGDFLTILQFSVGANLTFATILSLFDNILGREKRAAERLVDKVRSLKNSPTYSEYFRNTEHEALADARKLKLDVERFSSLLERMTFRWFRPWAVFSAAMALSLLIYATFVYSPLAPIWFITATFLTISPLIMFSIAAIFLTSRKLREFEGRRSRIDDIFLQLVDRCDPPIVPAE